MAEKIYRKVVDANGNESFVEVEVQETPVATTPTATQNPATPKKSFVETANAVWKFLRPILGGILIGASGMFAACWFTGSHGPDVPPTLPGSGNGLGNGTGGIDNTNY